MKDRPWAWTAVVVAVAAVVVLSMCLSAPLQSRRDSASASAQTPRALSGGTHLAPAVSGPTYVDYAGWNGNRSLYLTNYTGNTYLPATDDSSFNIQNTSNASVVKGCGASASITNAETVSVGTNGSNLSYYTYVNKPAPLGGWYVVMYVTDSGAAVPTELYTGPPNWWLIYSGFEDLVAKLSSGPSNSILSILPHWDTGVNITTGNLAGSSSTHGIDADLDAIAAGLHAFAIGADLFLPDWLDGIAEAASIGALIAEFLALSGAFSGGTSSYSYTTLTSGNGSSASANQWGAITPTPTTNGTVSPGGDRAYAQSTWVELQVPPLGSGGLPGLQPNVASLKLSANPSLGAGCIDVGGSGVYTWGNAVNGTVATLSYPLEPAVSLSGTVDLSPGSVASGATVLLQQSSCPSPYTSANYELTTNSSGGWQFFAAPGCTYTYSASASDGAQDQTLTSTSTTISVPSSAAGTSRTLATKTIGQVVTFEESGLPSWDDGWAVTMNGAELSGAGNPIQFVEPNGSYTYTVTPPSPYTASPSSGTTTVSGAAVTVPTITMSTTATLYTVKFSESGVPSGDSWEVCMNNQCPSSSSSSHSVSAYSGSYGWDAYDADVTTSGYYAPSPSSGTISVPSQTSVAITYSYHARSGGGGCVNFGTPVLTPVGYIPVQLLKAGDPVIEYNLANDQFFVGTFKSAAITDVSHVLSINHGELVVTLTDQPIWIQNASFVGWLHDPQNLTLGDMMFDPLTGAWVPVTSLVVLNENTRVYDVQTSVSNDYIANGILVDVKID